MMKILSLILMPVLLASCSIVENNPLVVDTTKTLTNNAAVAVVKNSEKRIDELNSCSIVASRNWKVSLNSSEENIGQNILTIHGEIDFPSSDYSARWQRGLLDRTLPPGLRLEIVTKKHDRQIKAVTRSQSTISLPLKHSVKTPIKNFRYISIYCGDIHLKKVRNVQVNGMSD